MGYPFTVDGEGYREVIKGHSFKLKGPLQYDVESLFPLLSQNHVLRHYRQSKHCHPLTFFLGKKGHHNPLGMVLRTWMLMQVS